MFFTKTTTHHVRRSVRRLRGCLQGAAWTGVAWTGVAWTALSLTGQVTSAAVPEESQPAQQLVEGQRVEGTPRETLKEPVYRVTTSVVADGTRPTRPVIDPALAAGDRTEPAGGSVPQIAPKLRTESPPKTVKDPQLLLALDDAAKCRQHIEENVRDYTCILIKRELVGGEVVGPDFIQTKVRHAVTKNGKTVVPFSVYMRFARPTAKRGREVLYLHGQHDNEVLIREAGWKGKIGGVWLARNNSLVMRENRHEIHEVGVMNLAERLLERGHADDGNVAGVDYTAAYGKGAEMNSRPCRYLDITFKTQKPQNEASKIRVLIDEELNMPVRYVAYGWPATTGSKPPVLEEYTYYNIKINQGLSDRDFDPTNPSYGF